MLEQAARELDPVAQALRPLAHGVALDVAQLVEALRVRPDAAVPARVRVVLEVGNLTESVTVTGGTEVVQTQSATVSTTITANQVNALPLVTKALHG